MKCSYCSKEFRQIYSWQKYCSLRCRRNKGVDIVREWRRKNPELYADKRKKYSQWNEDQKKSQLNRAKLYRQTMRGKLTLLNLHVKHRKQSNNIIKYEEFIEKFGKEKIICAICKTDQDLTFDHIKPFINGGLHTIDNIQVLCRSCNSIKGCYERYNKVWIQ